MKISEHAEKNRNRTPSHLYPGPFNFKPFPYLREIVDNMSPDSGIRRTIVMRAARTAINLAAESVMCYYIKVQPMSWPNFKPETEAGNLLEVVYNCEFCDDVFHESQKSFFLNKGRWIPKKCSNKKYIRSYHLPIWYVQTDNRLNGVDWNSIYKMSITAKSQPDERQFFMNMYMGMPFSKKAFHKEVENGLK